MAVQRAAVLRDLSPPGVRIDAEYENFPSFSCRVDTTNLVALMSDPRVAFIEPDREVQANLAQGIPLIEGSAVRAMYPGGGLSVAILLGAAVFTTDLAEAIGPECKQQLVGIRPGEKLHEEMITRDDSLMTIETAENYIMVPASPFRSLDENLRRFSEYHGAERVPNDFSYASDTNDRWLSVPEIRQLIQTHLDAEPGTDHSCDSHTESN